MSVKLKDDTKLESRVELYRDKYNAYETIIEACCAHGGATRTLMMYKTFTSFAQLKRFVWTLEDSGIIEPNMRNKHYNATEKGKEVLQILRELNGMLVDGSG
jgi:predicted transcriptional regulator